VDVTQRMTISLAVLMLTQAAIGLVFAGEYRDVAWIKATWFGNDWVTLLVASPLLSVSVVLSSRGSVRGCLLWLGAIAYTIYNYAFYLLGAALNAFFPIYVVAVPLAAITLILALSRLDVASIAATFRQSAPVRIIGACFVLIGAGLASVWLGLWAAYVFADRPTPVEPEAFKLVAALDLSLMVPALTGGGILLWRRHPWGYVIAAIAGVQGSLYLMVLSVNSIVSIQRGLATAPGELPLWGTLTVFTGAITAGFLGSVERTPSQTP
jgi:hypothetical protein